MKELLDMFLTFARIGGLTFGGGYAMLPMLQREVVEKRHWATEEELMDYYAIGQCTPGIIAVNTATFIGQKYRGTLGGIVATLGVVFPSVTIILLIAAFLQNFAHLPAVIHAFSGIRACVCALILSSLFKLGKSALKNRPAVVIFLTVLTLAAVGNFLTLPSGIPGIILGYLTSPVVLVLLAGLAGFLLYGRKGGQVK
jgi:chromate transporter